MDEYPTKMFTLFATNETTLDEDIVEGRNKRYPRYDGSSDEKPVEGVETDANDDKSDEEEVKELIEDMVQRTEVLELVEDMVGRVVNEQKVSNL